MASYLDIAKRLGEMFNRELDRDAARAPGLKMRPTLQGKLEKLRRTPRAFKQCPFIYDTHVDFPAFLAELESFDTN